MNVAETTVYGILSGDTAIVAVVADRIYHKYVPELKQLPAIVFIRSTTEYMNTIHSSQQLAGRIGIDIHCITTSDSASQALANLVALTAILKTNRADVYDPETETHSTIISVELWET